MLTVFLWTILALVVYGQPTELVCYNPPSPPDDATIVARSDVSLLQPLLERAVQLTEEQLEGLSIEEAAVIVPQILNNTAITLLKESLDINGTQSINPADLTLVSLQGLLNTTDGVQIFNTTIQDPTYVARTFLLLSQNFDLDCVDKPNIFWLTLLTTMMADILQPPFRDSFINIIYTTTVAIAQIDNTTEIFISVLEPLVENLEAAENVQGALGSLLSFVTEDAITVGLSSALEGSGFIFDPESIGEVFIAFFGQIQESFGLDGEEFVSFMNEIFKRILEALT